MRRKRMTGSIMPTIHSLIIGYASGFTKGLLCLFSKGYAFPIKPKIFKKGLISVTSSMAFFLCSEQSRKDKVFAVVVVVFIPDWIFFRTTK